ncbi:amidohydrolase [Mesobacillus sp. AQ2]|uniref:M20 metallopeptidase family protein n=1 Tax=Mesobacillus sp. AQ2 TaxID=3043332 RepID=UPI0024C110E9|nr:amidohydrolase [Mesobacillus sp. AQ2]WHX42613.1 amidohydrolase [Mesobacillus sp. AQ2]
MSFLSDHLIKQAVQDRRYLHQNPELSGEEYETSKYIRNRLEALGIKILDFEPPSVVGYIKGITGEKTLALRADIDALPMQEGGDKPYLSKNPGVAHTCGHDGHTAVLLAVAEWIVNNRQAVDHNILLIFQSSEEITPSGAEYLVNQGVLEGVDAIFGLHLWQGMKMGKLGLAHGPQMASCDDFEITIEGYGGHGASPHETVDPIYVASHVMQALHGIVSRKLNPITPGVITIGKIEAGSTYNIIPGSASLHGTVRGLTLEAVQTMRSQIKNLTEGISSAFGAKGKVNFILGTPPLVNDVKQSSFVEQVIKSAYGDEQFELVQPGMGAEDFSHYLLHIPGAFVFVGMGGEKSAYPHHHPKFDIDEDSLPIAIKLFVEIVKAYN